MTQSIRSYEGKPTFVRGVPHLLKTIEAGQEVKRKSNTSHYVGLQKTCTNRGKVTKAIAHLNVMATRKTMLLIVTSTIHLTNLAHASMSLTATISTSKRAMHKHLLQFHSKNCLKASSHAHKTHSLIPVEEVSQAVQPKE